LIVIGENEILECCR